MCRAAAQCVCPARRELRNLNERRRNAPYSPEVWPARFITSSRVHLGGCGHCSRPASGTARIGSASNYVWVRFVILSPLLALTAFLQCMRVAIVGVVLAVALLRSHPLAAPRQRPGTVVHRNTLCSAWSRRCRRHRAHLVGDGADEQPRHPRADAIRVTVPSTGRAYTATVTGYSVSKDIALLSCVTRAPSQTCRPVTRARFAWATVWSPSATAGAGATTKSGG